MPIFDIKGARSFLYSNSPRRFDDEENILLVEQNVRQSLKMAHRAYVLENGRIVMEGQGKERITNNHVKEAYLGL